MTKILHPKLAYEITGLCFKVHRKLGRFCRERQYAEALESLLKENQISYRREYELNNLSPKAPKGNIADFLIEDKIVLDLKAKKFITKEDYNQMQRYLQGSGLELGMIINFRNTYLKPKRVLNTLLYSDNSDEDTDHSDRYEILEHTADLKIKAFGKTKKELFENAMLGMYEAAGYRSNLKSQIAKVKIKVKAESLDLPSLLVDFLSEVIYLTETRWEIYDKVQFEELTDRRLRATLMGKKLQKMGVQIKGVTYHDLDVHQRKDGIWEATILFDI